MILVLRNAVFRLLCLIALMIPFEELISLMDRTASGISLVASLALLPALIAIISSRKNKPIPVIGVFLSIYILWCSASILWSLDIKQTFLTVRSYGALLLTIWMLWEFVDSEKKLFLIMRSYLVGCMISIGILFSSYFSIGGIIREGVRFTAGSMNQNRLATILALGLLFSAYLLAHPHSKYSLLYWLYFPSACLAILLTGSRGGGAAMILALLFCFLIVRKGSKKKAIALVLNFTCIVLIIPNIVPMGLMKRVIEGTRSSSFEQRKELWYAGIEIWLDAPIGGVGSGAFSATVDKRIGRLRPAHNTFIQILVEDGIVGFAIMLIVWILLVRTALKMARGERLLWLGVLCSWVLVSMSSSIDYAKFTWLIYGCTTVHGSLVMASNRKKTRPARSLDKKSLVLKNETPHLPLCPEDSRRILL